MPVLDTLTKPLARMRNYMWGVPPVAPVKPYLEMGSSGTAVYGGYITIKDTSPSWQYKERYRISSEIAVNASVVAAGIHYLLNLMAGPKWKAIPSDPEDQKAVDLAKFVDDVLNDMNVPWATVIRQAGMYRFHGFSIQEWTAKLRKDGKIGIKSIEVRPQHTIERWAVDEFGNVKGVFQRNPQNNELLNLPRDKFIYLVEDTLTDSPEGLGIFRHLLEPYMRLRRYLDLEARAYERDLRGIPVGRAPLSAINQAVAAGNLTSEDAAKLIRGMTDLISVQVKQSDTGILLDSAPYISTTAGGPAVSAVQQWGMELLDGPNSGLVEIASAIERIQREMARIIGVEHLMLGDVGGGRAVSQDKSRNVYLIAGSVLRQIVAAFDKDLIGIIWQLNGFPDELRPKLTAEDIAPRDVIEITTALARMAQAGATLVPDDPAVDDIRDLLGISRALPPPEPTPEEMMMLQNINPLTGEPMDTGEVDENGDPIEGGDGGGPPVPGKKPFGNRNTKDNMQRMPRNTAANKDPMKALTLAGKAIRMAKRALRKDRVVTVHIPNDAWENGDAVKALIEKVAAERAAGAEVIFKNGAGGPHA